MHVLIATPIYPPSIGGPATYTKLIEGEFAKQNISTTIVSFDTFAKWPKGIRHVLYFFNVCIRLFGVDILYALDPVSVGLPTALAARLFRKKYVVKIVGDYAWEQGVQRFGVNDLLDEFLQKEYVGRVNVLRKIQTWVAKGAQGIIVPSNYLKSVVQKWGVSADLLSVVNNAFTPYQHVLSKNELRLKYNFRQGIHIISIGRLVPWKGFVELIQVVDSLKDHISNLVLHIVGSGPDEKVLKKICSERGLSEHVIFEGRCEHNVTQELLRASDIFVLNTGYEGLSHTILEAFAAGTPVITTNVGGNPELVEHKHNGILVPYQNSDALQSAIYDVCQHMDEADSFADASSQLVQHFSKERMVNTTIKILSSL